MISKAKYTRLNMNLLIVQENSSVAWLDICFVHLILDALNLVLDSFGSKLYPQVT